ncbi:DNA recombination protein RmuC [Prevotella sp. tc2-28]|jgi:DNA recombination protein RmuC|nr:DNA recombination protein RmuC [Prevotella sp. tc2-28]
MFFFRNFAPMVTVLYIIIGVVIGAVIVYVLMNTKVSALHVELARKDTEMTMLEHQHSEEARLLQQQRNEEVKLREQQFNEQLKTTKEQLHVLAQQLMDAQAKRLKEENTESMGHITQPLKDAISEMRKAISDNIKDHTEQSASLREQLRLMMESNRQIGEKAESLANVLRRDNKVSGNMGEIILGDLLASQGLTEGIHFEVQARLRDDQGRPLKNDDTGREMQPDVILHYPQGQDVIIDSKVSLVAYQRYVNAEQPEEKERALQEHIKSVRQHVTELSRKDYSKYIKAPRESVDFVIMFVPFESSLQLALVNDPTLWRDAFERKVFITGEQNLLGILHMIHIAWVQNQQAENQEKVFDIAEQLLDRIGDFVQRYNKVGEQLDQARKSFEYSTNKLMEGRQSVVQKANELKALGAKENPNRRIPKTGDGLLEQ